MKITNLYSGSKGNATLVEIDGVNILIDCGMNYKQLNQRMLLNVGIDTEDINLVLITHSHIDHISSFKMLYKKHPDLMFVMSEKTLYGDKERNHSVGLIERAGIDINLERIKFIKDRQCLKGSKTDITAFFLKHDEPCIGFVIKSRQNESLCFIADNGGFIDNQDNLLNNHNYYLVESNYDETMSILDTKRRPDLKRRNLGAYGHTNNVQAIKNMFDIVGDKTTDIMFMHLSEDCNSEELAKDIHQTYIEIWNKEKLFKNIKICYAKQNEATHLK
jgi:phosphoribosyl 1,2-cyclic phosphodiesterase